MSNEDNDKTKKADEEEEETKEPKSGDDQQQQEEAPAKSIPLNAKWTMWFDNPRLAPAGSE